MCTSTGRSIPASKVNPGKGKLPRVVSLFSGAGGLDWGFQKNNYEIVFAVDKDPDAVATHKNAFPQTFCEQADLVEMGATKLVKKIAKHLTPGESIGVIGGPPCQGFSRSNTKSTADDPRNQLPRLYLNIVSELAASYNVEFIVFENVIGIEDKKHEKTFNGIIDQLHKLGLHQVVNELDAYNFGVPQHRNRVIIAAFESETALKAFKPKREITGNKTVRETIGDLPNPSFCCRGKTVVNKFHPNHWTMQPKSPRFTNPDSFSNQSRSFRKLDWDRPSPTVAYGHREIHVHPNGKRRLSIYEALLLQGFPTEFELTGSFSAQVQQVSNAVPPPLAYALAVAIQRALEVA